MNTTTAATTAGVTIATIRTWCRIGAIAAVKRAGRWIIDVASLTRRIAIGAMRRRTRQEATTVTDWNTRLATPRTVPATDHDGRPTQITVTPTVRDRERNGQRRISVTVLPLLADQLATIDPQYRAFAADMLRGVKVELRENPDPRYSGDAMRHIAAHRREGRVRTTYNGDAILPIDTVLDLGEQLWDHYFASH